MSYPPNLCVFNAQAISKPHAIDQLETDLKDHSIDVAIITETHLKKKHKDSSFAIAGYQLQRGDRPNRRGGGVAIFARDGYQSSAWVCNSTPVASFELLWVRLKHPKSSIFVGALYHPPAPQYPVNDLLDYIELCVDKIISECPNALIIMGGDFNQLTDNVIVEKTGLEPIVSMPMLRNRYTDDICRYAAIA